MQQFIVEIPTYLRLTVEAPDPEAAQAAAGALTDELTSQPPTLFRYADRHRGAVLTGSQLIDAGADDYPTAVYVCRGGKLSFIPNDGAPEPTEEDCPLAINQP